MKGEGRERAAENDVMMRKRERKVRKSCSKKKKKKKRKKGREKKRVQHNARFPPSPFSFLLDQTSNQISLSHEILLSYFFRSTNCHYTTVSHRTSHATLCDDYLLKWMFQ